MKQTQFYMWQNLVVSVCRVSDRQFSWISPPFFNILHYFVGYALNKRCSRSKMTPLVLTWLYWACPVWATAFDSAGPSCLITNKLQRLCTSVGQIILDPTSVNPASKKNVQRTLGGNNLGTMLWKVFLTFSECLCWSFFHNHQRIFTKHLTWDNPIFAHHFNYMSISGRFMFCVD